ncbi:testis-expressed protein 33 isoform X2 [Pristis pectinata]|nr:testis-expressed protein 33 isoform X2 [Pristis pectinata]
MKTKVTTANRFPGRSLFGTTLDSKGLDKELLEEEQLSDESKSCCQPGSPLVQGADNARRTQPLSSPKPGRCLDSNRTMSPKTESVENAVGSRQSLAKDRDCQTQLNKSHNTQAVSLERRIAEQQIGSEVIPAQGGTPDLRRGTPGMRSPLCETPERLPTQEEECLIPKNIQHKFRTHVVNEVLSDEKVKEFLYQKQLPAGNLDSKDTTAETQKSIIDETNTYEQIGYPLRCNIFPGFSGGWKSEAQSTYTKEVVERFKRDPEHWHGRTSDDLGHWVEMNVTHQRVKKALGELEKRLENS